MSMVAMKMMITEMRSTLMMTMGITQITHRMTTQC